MNLNRLNPMGLGWAKRLLGMFNLNDGRWGRAPDSQGSPQQGASPTSDPGANPPRPPDSDTKPDNESPPKQPARPSSGPPDLDDIWRDFNRKLGQLMGGPRVVAPLVGAPVAAIGVGSSPTWATPELAWV